MSFILQPSGATVEPIDAPVDLYTALTYSYVAGGGAYTWQCTNLDSFTTYTVSTTNGTVTFSSAGVLSYSPATVGIGGFTINDRFVELTIGTPVGYFESLNSTTAFYPYGAALDTSNNLYSAGYDGTYALLQKVNSSGVLQFQVSLNNAGNGVQFRSAAIDSLDNIIAGGYGTVTGNVIDYVVVKYNSSGVLQWQKSFGGASPQYEYGQAVAVDAANSVLVCGYVTQPTGGAPYEIVTVKFNSSGTYQWQKKLAGSYTVLGQAVACDTSSNVYITGQGQAGAGAGFITAKYNSAGTLQWQRFLKIGSSYGSSNDLANGIVVDSAGDVYVTGYSNAGQLAVTAKYNSTGTLQWQRTLTANYGIAIAADTSNNIYVLCTAQSTPQGLYLIKYNSSGTIQFQRSITSSIAINNGDISVNASGIYITAQFATTAAGSLNIRLPLDGSSTSTYTNGAYSIIYAAGSQTSATSGYVDSAGGLTDSTPAYGNATPVMTAGTTTYTSTLTLF